MDLFTDFIIILFFTVVEDRAAYYDEKKWKKIRSVRFDLKKFMIFAGPGIITSIAYIDPGNIAGDLNAGVQGNYHLIWAVLWATGLGLYFQTLAIRVGLVT